MPPRRVLLFIGILIVTLGIGFGLYVLFFQQDEEVPVVPIEEIPGQQGELPSAGTGGPTPVTPIQPGNLPPGTSIVASGGNTVVSPVASVPTSGATITATGALAFYNRSEGKFYRMESNGTMRSLSDKTFRNVSDVTFDGQGNKAIMEFPDGANILYDFSSSRQVTLPRHWEGFGFSANGDQIVAKSIGTDPANRFLVVANADGSSARAVQELGNNADKVIPDWSPNNQIIATAVTGDFAGVDRPTVFFVGANNENFKSMVVEGLGFIPQWSPSGNRLLYSAASSLSDYKPLLWIVDAAGDDIGKNRKSLAINTWADKCTFGATDDVLYCAVPRSLERGAGLQRAVAATIPDSIVRIDTRTGLQSRVAIPEGDHTISKVILSPDGRFLYFTDQATGSLNKIQLAP